MFLGAALLRGMGEQIMLASSAFALGDGVLDALLERGALIVGLVALDLQRLADLARSTGLAGRRGRARLIGLVLGPGLGSVLSLALGDGVLDAVLERGALIVGLLALDHQRLADLARSTSFAGRVQSRGSRG